jgi:hypothetical protein
LAASAVTNAAAAADAAAAWPAAVTPAAADAPLSSISATPAVPENVISAWATPAARTSDVVVRRMRLVYNFIRIKNNGFRRVRIS